MKIVFVLDETWGSALTYYGKNVLEVISDRYQIEIFCIKDSFIDNSSSCNKVYIKPLRNRNPIKIISAFASFAKLLRSSNPDIVFAIRGDATFFSCLLKKSLNFKLVRIFGENRKYHPIKNCLDGVIFPSEKLQKSAILKNTLPTIVIPGVVDRDKFRFNALGRKSIRDEFSIKDDEILFGSVGRLDPVKGYPELLEAFSDLSVPNTKLLIVGEQKNENVINLGKIIRKYNLTNRVTIETKRRDDIANVMSAFDIGVIPSVGSESIARVMLEFMSIGLPVIHTSVGIMSEISNPDFAYMSAPNAQSLSESMKSMLKSNLSAMGKNAKQRSFKYSKPLFKEQIEKFMLLLADMPDKN